MILETSNITKHFGGLKAVSGVNLKIAPGAIHSIIGPNGAGKTTLFNLITGAIPPAAGHVVFDGNDVTGWSPERLAKVGLARTFQRTSIFKNLSVVENVALAIRSREGVSRSI